MLMSLEDKNCTELRRVANMYRDEIADLSHIGVERVKEIIELRAELAVLVRRLDSKKNRCICKEGERCDG